MVTFPLVFYLPPLLGPTPVDAKTVAAIVATQIFFSTMVGGAAHFRSDRVQWRLAFAAGLSSALAVFVGRPIDDCFSPIIGVCDKFVGRN